MRLSRAASIRKFYVHWKESKTWLRYAAGIATASVKETQQKKAPKGDVH